MIEVNVRRGSSLRTDNNAPKYKPTMVTVILCDAMLLPVTGSSILHGASTAGDENCVTDEPDIYRRHQSGRRAHTC